MRKLIEPDEVDVVRDFNIMRPHLHVYCFAGNVHRFSKFTDCLKNTIGDEWPIYFLFNDAKEEHSKWKHKYLLTSSAIIIDLPSIVGRDCSWFESAMILGRGKKSFIFGLTDGYSLDPAYEKTYTYAQSLIQLMGYKIQTIQEAADDFAEWSSNILVENKTIASSISLKAGVR